MSEFDIGWGRSKRAKRPLFTSENEARAIGEAADMLSGMIGVGSDFDPEADRIVKAIDKFLKTNSLKREFK